MRINVTQEHIDRGEIHGDTPIFLAIEDAFLPTRVYLNPYSDLDNVLRSLIVYRWTDDPAMEGEILGQYQLPFEAMKQSSMWFNNDHRDGQMRPFVFNLIPV